MNRLFFSLYLMVVIAIAFIGWSSELVWQYIQTNSNTEIAQVARLSKAMQLIDHLDEPKKQIQLAQVIGYQVSLVSTNDIAWLQDNKLMFDAGEPVLTYDDQGRLYIYIKLTSVNFMTENKRLIRVGPIELPQQQVWQQRFFILFSYLMLALAIGLWSRPLWRDLLLLQQATRKFGQGQWKAAPVVSDKSVIAPIVKTFKQMSSKIASLVEEQKALTNAVSHELRTPLSRLKFSLALLDHDKNEAIIDMRQDVNELEGLVDEMLSYRRLESKMGQLVLTDVSINQLVENLVEKLSINSNRNIKVNLSKDVGWTCDGHYLERAIQNLLTNAIYYSKTNIIVSVNTTQKELIIKVEDDGCGINEEQRKAIFKPFIRLDVHQGNKQGGFGLGLSIVKLIIDKHQGTCRASVSELGGALFTMTIPLIEASNSCL